MKILWIGKYASEEIFIDMATKGYKDPAAQLSQSNLINSFDKLDIQLDTINAYNVPADYEERYIRPQSWTRTVGSHDVSVGYYNIKYISHLLIANALKTKVENWARNNKNEEVKILVYGMQSSLMSAAIKAKRIISNSIIIQIIPDLPQFMDYNMTSIKKVLKSIDWINIKRLIHKIDGFVLYTKHMADFLNIERRKWIVMEGSIDIKYFKKDNANEDKNNRIIVMYSGKIDRRYGIVELLKAISLIEGQDYEFWFSGHGNAIDLLNKHIEQDNRIKYLGFVPTRQELLIKQSEATMLMNMRLPTEHGSAYCFPSKIFEYMASGKPVLSFRVNGIPEEYYKYLIEIKTTNPSDIAEKIKEVAYMSCEERRNIGLRSKDFILQKKNSLMQTQKIIEFIMKFKQ